MNGALYSSSYKEERTALPLTVRAVPAQDNEATTATG